MCAYLLHSMQYPQLFSSCPVRLTSGLLLYGMPGTGKTYLAKAVAQECSVRLIYVKVGGLPQNHFHVENYCVLACRLIIGCELILSCLCYLGLCSIDRAFLYVCLVVVLLVSFFLSVRWMYPLDQAIELIFSKNTKSVGAVWTGDVSLPKLF